jgi:2-enoate reductase
VGNDFPISFRWNIDEFLEGGRDLKRSQDDARLFEKAGIDLINISGGNFWIPGSAAHSCPPMSYPQGHLRHLAKAMKDVVDIPVMLSSKIAHPRTACEILQGGEADFIGLGRGLLADPEWPNKTAHGRFDDIRPCIRDMDGCINRVVEQKRISCTVNPGCGMEGKAGIRPTDNPMEVVVVGGGVGGMEAARVAALRGHEVTLFEGSDTLGGQARLAGMIPYKEDIARFIRYQEKQIQEAGVVIRLGQVATPELIMSLQPRAVILATGSYETTPKLPGIDGSNVFYARDVVAETVDVKGEKIVVAGGGFVGRDIALFLTVKKRKQALILEQLTLDAVGAAPYDANAMDILKMLGENGVEIMTETKVEEINRGGVQVTDKHGETIELECSSIVLALGVMADRGLADTLRDKVPNLYTIGDCNHPGKIFHAMRQGFFTAQRI